MRTQGTLTAARVIALLFAVIAVVPDLVQLSWNENFFLLTGLVIVAGLLRCESRRSRGSFEPLVLIGATVAIHDAGLTVLAAFFGVVIAELAFAAWERSWNTSALDEVAHLTIATFLSSVLYVRIVPPDAPWSMRIIGALTMAVAYLMVRFAFDSAPALFAAAEEGKGAIRLFALRTRVLLYCVPLIALEALLYPHYGAAGFVLAFAPVFLINQYFRGEDARQRDASSLRSSQTALELLKSSSADLMTAEEDQETFRRLTRIFSRLAPMKACAVVTWYSNPGETRVHRFGDCQPQDAEIARRIAAERLDVSVPRNPVVVPAGERAIVLSEGSAYQAILGLQTIEVVYGVVIYESDSDVLSETGNADMLRILVEQTAASIQSQMLRRQFSTLNRELEQQHERVRSLVDVARTLIEDRDSTAMLTRLAESIAKTLRFNRVVFWAAEDRLGDHVPAACAGACSEEMTNKRTRRVELDDWMSDEFRVANAYYVSKNTITEDMTIDEHRPDWHPSDRLILPLEDGANLLGFLAVDEPSDMKVPSFDTLQVLELYQNQAVSALRSVRQHDQIQHLTLVDSLTVAFNHRHFQEALRKEVQRHERTSHGFALAMLDIDDFKAVNDTYGHQVGDDILRQLVDRLILNVREIDIVARYGGEEFAIIFPELTVDRAFEVAERLRMAAAGAPFDVPHQASALRVTVSIGIASFPQNGFTSRELVGSADRALYKAKHAGKNRVFAAWESQKDPFNVV